VKQRRTSLYSAYTYEKCIFVIRDLKISNYKFNLLISLRRDSTDSSLKILHIFYALAYREHTRLHVQALF